MNKTAIVSIHGILTKEKDDDKWQETFDTWLDENRTGILHLPYTYGWLGPINSWLAKTFDWLSDTLKLPRWTRRTRIENFKKFLYKVIGEYGSTNNIHIMAHSFGTFIATEALKEMSAKNHEYFICSVNLVAGIISSNIEKNGYDRLLGNGRVGTFHSWSSHSDKVVRYIARWPFGHLGYWGIIRPYVSEDRTNPARKPYAGYRAFNNHDNIYYHNGYFTFENIFYPAFLTNIKGAEKWEETRRKKAQTKSLKIYRKSESRGRSNHKRK